MVTTGAKIKFTYEDYCNAPEDKRYELHDGDLILVPSPKEPHQKTSLDLAAELRLFTRRTGIGYIYIAPFDVFFSNTDVVQPDVIFVSSERLEIITPDNIRGAPDLVIEVLSPSTAHRGPHIQACPVRATRCQGVLAGRYRCPHHRSVAARRERLRNRRHIRRRADTHFTHTDRLQPQH